MNLLASILDNKFKYSFNRKGTKIPQKSHTSVFLYLVTIFGYIIKLSVSNVDVQ